MAYINVHVELTDKDLQIRVVPDASNDNNLMLLMDQLQGHLLLSMNRFGMFKLAESMQVWLETEVAVDGDEVESPARGSSQDRPS